jgi:probable DNA repair protein
MDETALKFGKQILKQFASFDFIVTPNRRLATFLSRQLVANLPAGQYYSGKILSWNGLLQDYWQAYRDLIQAQMPRRLLSDWQSHFFWQQVIANADCDMPLLDTAETVHLAKQAHALLQQWRYPVENLHGIKADTDLFLHWQAEYQQLLQESQAVDAGQLAESILKALAGTDKLEKRFLLYDFDGLSPEQERFFAELRSLGAHVDQPASPQRAKEITRYTFSNISDEITAIALQAKAILAETPNLNLPLGIVVPQLSEHWRLIRDIFADTFVIGNNLPGYEDEVLPFNISAGRPLHDMPIIFAVWTLFELLQNAVSTQTWSKLCRTPFIAGGISEMAKRAQLELRLRNTQVESLSWDWVLARKDIPEQLSLLLQAAHKFLQTKPKTAKPSEWQAWLLDCLQVWGWPGERNLNSEEYQAVTHFYQLLNELCAFDTVMAQTSLGGVLSQLRTQAKQRMFQGESEGKPIQVLGMLEAAGLQFSHLWITGMSHDVWPQKPSPNPFIPTHVQIAENMPHANAKREYEYAQTMLQRLLSASDTVHLSYAQFDLNSDSQRLPSPLILQFNEKKVSAEVQAEELSSTLQKQNKIIAATEPEGLPVGDDVIRGGVGIFKDQAACPFRAYARYRLKAVAPELPMLGIAPKTKGTLLHTALETIWRQLQTQNVLQALDDKQLNNLCQQHLTKAFAQISPKVCNTQQQLEIRRAMPLLQAWLQIEKARDDFTVQGIELAQEASIAGLPLSLRLDRIDALPDGSFLLIDYKTGDVNSKQWLGLRPDEPQLPLYASLMSAPPSGIAFAVLRRKKVELISLNQENSDWPQQLQDWQQAMHGLALEFQTGRADLAPKYGPKTCQQCDLQLFCRVGEK